MTTSGSSVLKRIRWAWALPILAVALTSGLIVLAEHQDAAFWATHPGSSDTPAEFQAPARFFEQLINGPGFYFPMPYEFVYGFARLLGVALFWAWLGVGLDRRLHGARSHVIQSRLCRAATYTTLLGLTVLFAWRFFGDLLASLEGASPRYVSVGVASIRARNMRGAGVGHRVRVLLRVPGHYPR